MAIFSGPDRAALRRGEPRVVVLGGELWLVVRADAEAFGILAADGGPLTGLDAVAETDGVRAVVVDQFDLDDDIDIDIDWARRRVLAGYDMAPMRGA